MRTFALLVATAGGVGYAPVASGTFGTLVAVPFLPALAALRARAPLAGVLVVAAVVALAIWSAGRADEALGEHDSGRIVIDEVAGMLVAGLFVPGDWLAIALAFVAFRAFDIVKPWPAGRFDRQVAGGVGVVGDDLIAGAYAGLATRVVLEVLR